VDRYYIGTKANRASKCAEFVDGRDCVMLLVPLVEPCCPAQSVYITLHYIVNF